MSTPDWSDEHISLANRFVAQVVVAWLVLVAVSALFARTGTFGFVFVGFLTLAATWLLVHALFMHVDRLVKTRLEEATTGVSAGTTSSGDDAEDSEPDSEPPSD